MEALKRKIVKKQFETLAVFANATLAEKAAHESKRMTKWQEGGAWMVFDPVVGLIYEAVIIQPAPPDKGTHQMSERNQKYLAGRLL